MCIYVHIYAYMHIHMYACMYIWMYVSFEPVCLIIRSITIKQNLEQIKIHMNIYYIISNFKDS